MSQTARKIIHIDMDAFFASVEQRDHPELRGLPVAIGYDGPRGVVATASYEARPFGVHSAMSMARAKRLCPQLVVVEGNHRRYKEVSQQIHEIFHSYTDLIEPLSLDEAFLDVTDNKMGIPLAVDIARDIRQRIRSELSLTASAGVSYNKLLAKIASDWRKPDGLTVIHPDRALDFIARLKIEKLWGVGPRTAERMHRMGIITGYDLRQQSRGHLMEVFGKAGGMYYDFARGIDQRPVVTDYVRKSVGCERTFAEDLTRRSALLIELYHTVLELERRIGKTGFVGTTLTLKTKFDDFTQQTRSLTVSRPLLTKADILPLAKQLLTVTSRPIRLLGLSVSNPAAEPLRHSAEWTEGWLEFEEDYE
ncbi:MAG: DNA polymerase IV [Prevotella sp.]|nr:DNA polymerase IV [Prevotella sp.]